MRKTSSMAVIAAIAAAGLLVPVTTLARGGGGGGGRGGGGFGHVAIHCAFHGTFVRSAHGPGFHHHGFRHGGFWGWGGCCGVSSLGGGYVPGPVSSPDYADVPAVDFYNGGAIYTGGPYGFPLANGSYPAIAHDVPLARGCDAHEQVVPNAHHGLSSVTIVRC